jgi:hypothetical protein
MSSNKNDPDFDPEDRRKHLEFIQAVIARLAGASAAAKAASLTVATAAFGFSAINENWYLSLLGLAVVISFATVDAYYLHKERLYRDLYQDVVDGNAHSFSMTCTPRPEGQRKPVDAYRSWSVIGFYATLAFVGLVAAGLALAAGAEPAEHEPGSHPRPSASPSATR